MHNAQTVTTAAIYIRVSTDEQLDLSPDSQLLALREFANQNNIRINPEYIFIETEGISGRKSSNRPEFQRMIAIAKTTPKPFDSILVWKYSRFARNQDESTFYKSMLRKKLDIDIISASEPIIEGMYGRLMEMIIEWQDEFYSYNLSMEVTRSMRAKALKGGYNGSTFPIGYVADQNRLPIIDPKTAPIIQLIFQLYTSGHDRNYIVRQLNEKGFRTKTDKLFTSEAVAYILSNPFYIGKIRWNMRSSHSGKCNPEKEWIIADAHHEALIDEALFHQAINRTHALKTMHSKYQHSISHTKHWLSGLIKCSICGKSLSFKKGSTHTSHGFQCLGYRQGLHNQSQYLCERKLIEYVITSLTLSLWESNFEYQIIAPTSKHLHTTIFYDDEIKRLMTKEKRAKNAYLNGIDSIEEYQQNKTIIKNRIKELEQLLSKSSENLNQDTQNTTEEIINNIVNIIDLLKSNCTNEKKAIALRSIVQKMIYIKDQEVLICSYVLIS